MRKKLLNANIPVPCFHLVNDNNLSSVKKGLFSLKESIIVKPTDRSGSRGVELVDRKNPEQLEAALERALSTSFSREAIIENLIDGTEYSVESISYCGEHYIVAITQKVTTGPPSFIEKGHFIPANIPLSTKNKIENVTKKALHALCITDGPSHTELISDTSGNIHIVEVGPRMGGDFIGSTLVKLSTGYDFLKGMIDVSLATFEPPIIGSRNRSGITFLFPPSGIIKKIKYKNLNHSSIIAYHIDMIEGKSYDRVQESSNRKGYVIYKNYHTILEQSHFIQFETL